ncbi:MAG: hypothetical protein LBU06_10105 [Desulfovibrio sp.]|jgi:hypothetical protein|nr:hypothetical protein [Desulfovibrio sp.]
MSAEKSGRAGIFVGVFLVLALVLSACAESRVTVSGRHEISIGYEKPLKR